MIGRRTLLVAVAAIAAPVARAQVFRDTMVPVHGQLLSRNQGPVPGVAVSLVHQQLGRSSPSHTDGYGRFGWTAIPVRPEPYYLEMYWGSKLIYRSQLFVQGPLVMQPVVL
jgi:hypothetical protein